jgi:hypothetical protein
MKIFEKKIKKPVTIPATEEHYEMLDLIRELGWVGSTEDYLWSPQIKMQAFLTSKIVELNKRVSRLEGRPDPFQRY